MTLYDDMMQGAIDIHCHIDFEFSATERKREPEFLWLPKAEAMGMRGIVLKSHWWPTVNVVPYINSSMQTKVSLWSSVALNLTAGGPDPCIIEAAAELGGKMTLRKRASAIASNRTTRIMRSWRTLTTIFSTIRGNSSSVVMRSSKSAKRTI
jgi:hypothetical protein